MHVLGLFKERDGVFDEVVHDGGQRAARVKVFAQAFVHRLGHCRQFCVPGFDGFDAQKKADQI